MISKLLSLFLLHLCVMAVPGPDFFMASRMALRYGRRPALYTVGGITAGCAVWCLLAIAGLTLLLKQLPALHFLILVLGGAYLVITGAALVRSSFKKQGHEEPGAQSHPPLSHGSLFLKGFLADVSNAKVFIYFGSVFSLFIHSDTALYEKTAIFTMLCAETFAWFSLVAWLFSTPNMIRQYALYTHIIDRVAGVLFILCGCEILRIAL